MGRWVEPDIRDEIVTFVEKRSSQTELSKRELIGWVGITPSRYYDWRKRTGQSNHHNGSIPRDHWILAQEREAIIAYCSDKLEDGYRRLTYMMLDEDIVAVSPSTTYRVLKAANLLNRWRNADKKDKPGFTQPEQVHDHWHVDISHINILGTIFFLVTVLDGRSRYIVAHDLRANMNEYDVEIVVQRGREAFPDARPRMISDNGPQFVSKDFKEFIRLSGFSHVRTRPYYPQSNGKLERFHGTIKSEEIRRNSYLDIDDARARIKTYIQHYNTRRLHSSIYYLTPQDVLEARIDERLRQRQQKLDQARERRKQQRNLAA
jgi:transposase InsO family protein